MAKIVLDEQMAHQREFIYKIKEENERFLAENGRRRLANTECKGKKFKSWN